MEMIHEMHKIMEDAKMLHKIHEIIQSMEITREIHKSHITKHETDTHNR